MKVHSFTLSPHVLHEMRCDSLTPEYLCNVWGIIRIIRGIYHTRTFCGLCWGPWEACGKQTLRAQEINIFLTILKVPTRKWNKTQNYTKEYSKINTMVAKCATLVVLTLLCKHSSEQHPHAAKGRGQSDQKWPSVTRFDFLAKIDQFRILIAKSEQFGKLLAKIVFSTGPMATSADWVRLAAGGTWQTKPRVELVLGKNKRKEIGKKEGGWESKQHNNN